MSQTDSVTRQARKMAFAVVAIQAGAALLLATVWGMLAGWAPFFSMIMGALSVIFPAYFFAWYFFKTTRAADARRIVLRLLLGEFAKLFLSGLGMVIILTCFSVKLFPLCIGYIVAQFGFWLAPLWVDLNKPFVPQRAV